MPKVGKKKVIKEPVEILLVEDNAEYSANLSGILEKENIKVTNVFSAELAIEYLKKKEPDVIVLDIMLGDKMNGFDFITYLKSSRRYPHIPVIFISALSHIDKIEEGLSLGANDYLVKPFGIAELGYKIINLARLKKNVEKRHNTEHIIEQVSNLDSDYKLAQLFVAEVNELVNNCLEMTVTDIVKKLNTYFTKLDLVIKKYHQQTPVNFILAKRLQRADLMLRNSNISINNIAFQCGFNSTSYFCTAFKKYYEKSPMQARKGK